LIVREGISGSGKSTLAALQADRPSGRPFHTVPAPVSDLQPYINANARPLAQLAFYLAGVLHASDLARDALMYGHVIADRYLNSVIANHAAVHQLATDTVANVIASFTSYLIVPDLTVSLHTSPTELARRMHARPDTQRSRPAHRPGAPATAPGPLRPDRRYRPQRPACAHHQPVPAALADIITAMLPAVSIPV
jgi:thymidylate kinase